MTREEAIKVIKSATVYTPEEMKALETLIPELRESEDERIRKEIICFIEYEEARGNIPDRWYQAKRPGVWIAYLEKQKRLYSDYEESELRRGLLWHLKELQNIEESKGLPIKSKATYSDWIAWLEKQKEQKPWKVGANAYFTPEQKPAEWSEEDEDMLNSCISSIEEAKENRYAYKETDGDTSYDHEIDWLKSLRPSWKPSEEQMKALKDAVKLYKDTHFERFHTRIESLYEQLKAL